MNDENRIDVLEYLHDRRDFAWNAFLKTGLPVYHGIAFRAGRRIAAIEVGLLVRSSNLHLGEVAKSLIDRVNRISASSDNLKNDNLLKLG